jgi:hypothetical protein
MHQSFRLNGSNYYTIFDLPIAVTNQISANNSRANCNSLNNPLLRGEQVNATGPPTVLPYSVGKVQGAGAALRPGSVLLMAALFLLGLCAIM